MSTCCTKLRHFSRTSVKEFSLTNIQNLDWIKPENVKPDRTRKKKTQPNGSMTFAILLTEDELPKKKISFSHGLKSTHHLRFRRKSPQN